MKNLSLLVCGFVLICCEIHEPVLSREPESPFFFSETNYLIIKHRLVPKNHVSPDGDTLFLLIEKYHYIPKIIAHFKTRDALEKALNLQNFQNCLLIDILENKVYRIEQERVILPKYKFILRRTT
jgi:hypothetical protein